MSRERAPSIVSPRQGDALPLPSSCFGMDIGGTLCKLAYFQCQPGPPGTTPIEETPKQRAYRELLATVIAAREPYGETGARDEDLEFDVQTPQGHFYLMRFETRKMEKFLAMVKENGVINPSMVLGVTGGGARKYADVVRETLGFEPFCRGDELQCLIGGINYCLAAGSGSGEEEMYRFDHVGFGKLTCAAERESAAAAKAFRTGESASFPYILVNIGSGVSIMRVESDGTHARIGGTSLGGSTFLSLACIITGAQTFTEALALAAKGDASAVDLLVGDIYGGDYSEFDLPSDTVAASLGKCVRPSVRAKAKPEDLARALLDTFTNNIGSIAMLNARGAGVQRIVFAGSFLRTNVISVARLAYAVEYWSKGKMQALFLRHEGYLGALGALTLAARLDAEKAASPPAAAAATTTTTTTTVITTAPSGEEGIGE